MKPTMWLVCVMNADGTIRSNTLVRTCSGLKLT